MFKKVLCILSLMWSLPVLAGEFESALNDSNNVFLYLYTPECGFCTKFNPVYKKVSKNYSQVCQFLKMDATKGEGLALMHNFGVRYVPFVILVNSKKKEFIQLNPSCLLDYKCTEQAVKKFAI